MGSCLYICFDIPEFQNSTKKHSQNIKANVERESKKLLFTSSIQVLLSHNKEYVDIIMIVNYVKWILQAAKVMGIGNLKIRDLLVWVAL